MGRVIWVGIVFFVILLAGGSPGYAAEVEGRGKVVLT